MSSLFHQAILDYYNSSKSHQQYDVWLNYALSTDQRGRYAIDKLLKFTFSLKGKRLLDIGSGYGGTCIAAAQRGAQCVGIEIDPKLIELADINRQDHPHLATIFFQMDILDWEQAKRLGHFELITCDNVIEHVAVPERLIAHISLLLRKGGFAYITIPNAYSINQVRSDCHYGLFGISLLDPCDAAVYLEYALGQTSYDVSVYHHLEEYLSFFRKYNLKPLIINSPTLKRGLGEALQAHVAELKKEFEAVLRSGQAPLSIAPKLEKVFELYIQQIESCVFYYEKLPDGTAKDRLGWHLEREYLEEVWYVAAFQSKRIPLTYHWRGITGSGVRKLKPFIRKLENLVHDGK